MRDGRTVRKGARARSGDLEAFLERYDATLVVVRGSDAGEEIPLDAPKLVIGRGPGVDVAFDDDEMSAQHLAIEWSGGRFRVCDLGSTNGTQVNGARVQARDLATGDRVECGGHVLQLRIEQHPPEPKRYLVPDD
jgi:pSer/pThr/pTyr-binding forkhead associated (FHA) protein